MDRLFKKERIYLLAQFWEQVSTILDFNINFITIGGTVSLNGVLLLYVNSVQNLIVKNCTLGRNW